MVQFEKKRGGQVSNAVLYDRYRVDFKYRVGHYNGFIKLNCNAKYHYTQKMILIEDDFRYI